MAEWKPDRRFKSHSPIIARLPGEATEALRAWKAKTENNAPDAWIWPRRPHGKMTKLKVTDHSMRTEYANFLKRHDIKTWVRMAHFRHWIEKRGEDDGIPNVYLAYIRGHAVKKATEGGHGYSGNRRHETVLADQETRWPAGPCGVFTAKEIQVVDELTPFMAVMQEYAKGEMNTAEMAQKIENIRLKLLMKQTVNVPP